MIAYTTTPDSPVLGFKVDGTLSAEDYEQVLMPEIEKRIKAQGKARVLIEWGENFSGWSPKAMIDDARLGFAHWNDFEKLALVGAPKWAGFFARLFDAVSKGAVKVFDADQYEEALAWASS